MLLFLYHCAQKNAGVPDNMIIGHQTQIYLSLGMRNSSACLKYPFPEGITNGADWYPKVS